MTLPNFLILGPPRAGTTSLYRYLVQHPDVYMPKHLKEPRFFCYDGTETSMRIPVTTLEDYTRLFDDVTTEHAIGEASPQYLASARAAVAIKELIPDAKLIASLRNPVERAHSTYVIKLRDRGANRNLSFLQALEIDPDLGTDYFNDLTRYYGLFPRENIKVILFDRLISDTKAAVRETCEFLGVDPSIDINVDVPINRSGLPKSPSLHRLMSYARKRMIPVKHLVPRAIKRQAHALWNSNLQIERLTEEERHAAKSRFRESILRTQDLVSTDLSGWL